LETARDLAQTLLLNQGFENLTKKSLLARFIRIHPTIQSLLAGESSGGKEDEGFIVSQASFDKAKQEYEELIAVKIPENKEAIAIAREHGDLKENSEYKMARQDQDILLTRKNELEVDLSRARVTDFSEAESGSVGIGSVVDLEEGSSGQTVRYAILGAWDSDPEKNVLSYKTPLAQKLLNAGLGASVQTNIGGNEEVWKVLSIARWVDQSN
jgi:transcription elongation factor GreA